MRMKFIFYNKSEKRIRGGWRICVVTLIAFLCMLLIAALTSEQSLFTIFLAAGILLLLWFSAKHIDKRPFSEYGFWFSAEWVRDFVAGNIIAATGMAFIVGLNVWMGWIVITDYRFTFTNFDFVFGLLGILVVMTAVSLWEEAYFRSYLILNIKESVPDKWVGKKGSVVAAVLFSSVFFGLVHLGNPNSSWISTMNISIAGLVFAYPYIITKSIAIPVGMHLSWNYFQGAVFGLPVSGAHFDQVMMGVEVTGPEVFTGGNFGPEAGVAGLLGFIVLLGLNEFYIILFYKNKSAESL